MKRGQTLLEKIVSKNLGTYVYANQTVWLKPDLVTARDFAGPNAVLKFEQEFPNQPVFNPNKILFTFDCGHDLKYSTNQDIVREFAKKQKIKISEIDHGIGTHVLIQQGLAHPGQIITGTDSHFGILGAVNALGIAVGDTQTAFAFKTGLLEYTVPETIKVNITGKYTFPTSAKDLALHIIKTLGAAGALGKVLEFSGETVENLDLAGRITLASLGAEMSSSAVLIHPNQDVLNYTRKKSGKKLQAILADEDASYSKTINLNVNNLEPQIARPGNPREVIPVSKIKDIPINQVLIGSCTNSTYEDIERAAYILKGKKIKPGVRFYIVPGTQETYQKLLQKGLTKVLTDAGAIVYPSACAGCTSEQIGKLGSNTVAVDTGNRNFTNKQGPGIKYLVSPETAAASGLAGKIISAEEFKVPRKLWSYKGKPVKKSLELVLSDKPVTSLFSKKIEHNKPTKLFGKAWIIGDNLQLFDDIDTDAIYHNSRLTITDPNKMGQYTFEQFDKYKSKEFIENFQPGDIVMVGENFGCGSSREHAVKCFMSLGASLIIGRSFAPIYQTNAETLGFPLIECRNIHYDLIKSSRRLEVDLQTGEIHINTIFKLKGKALTESAMLKYQAGGLFGLAK